MFRRLIRSPSLNIMSTDFSPIKSDIVLRPSAHMVQFCIPGVDISSWDNNIRIVSIFKHQISGSNSGEMMRSAASIT